MHGLPDDLAPRRAQRIADAHAAPRRLVGIDGPNTAAGGADLGLPEQVLFERVELPVVGQDEVRALAEQERAEIDPRGLQRLDLFQQSHRIDRHTMGDDRPHAGPQRAGHQVQAKGAGPRDDRVPGVGAALAAHHHM